MDVCIWSQRQHEVDHLCRCRVRPTNKAREEEAVVLDPDYLGLFPALIGWYLPAFDVAQNESNLAIRIDADHAIDTDI